MARRVRKWIKRGLLGLLVLIVLAIGVVMLTLHTDTGRSLIASQVANALKGAFPGGAKIGKIEGSPFGTLVVHDIELNGPDGKPFIKIDKVEAEVTVTAIVHGKVHVDRVHADGVTVTNPRPPGPPKPPEPGAIEIELPNITVEHAKVVLDDTPQGKIELVDTNIFAALHLSSGWGPVGIFASVDGRWAQRDAKVSAIVQLQIGDQIEVPFASVSAGGVSVYVAGVATGKDMDQPAGKIVIAAPKKAVASLIPGVELPDDARIAINASTTVPPKGMPASTIAFSGSLGAAKVDGVFQGEIATLSARGSLAVRDVDVGVLSNGAVPGKASTAVFVSVEKGHLHGTVAAQAQVMQFAPVSVVAAFDATPDNVHGMALASGAGGLRLAAAGGLKKDGEALALSATHVGVSIADASAATGGMAPVRGAVDIDAQVAGEFNDLAVTGKVVGTRLRVNQLGIARVAGSFAGRIGKKPTGIARLSVDGVTNAGQPVGDADVDATARPDGTIGVVATAHAAAVKGTVDIAANVTLGDAIEVALSSHRIALPAATWAGEGGHVHIGDDAITVKNFRTTSGNSSLAVDASMSRTSGALSADVEAKDISLAMIDPKFKGLVGAKIEVTNRGIAWKGNGLITAKGVVIDPEMKPLDANVSLGVDGRNVNVAVKASTGDIGEVRVALGVEGPRDLTDVAGWQRLRRDDLHSFSIGFDKLNIFALTNGKAPGMLDGILAVKGGTSDNVLTVSDIPTPLGPASGTLALELDDNGGLDVMGDGTVGAIGGAKVIAHLFVPEHPFAPLEWKKLGINALHSATVETSDIAVTPALLQQIGIVQPMSGHVSAKVDVGAGLSSVDASVNVTKITGGPLVRPADLQVIAHVDDKQTTAEVHLAVGGNKFIDLQDTHVPVSLDMWLADPKAALNAKLAANLLIRTSYAKTILAAIGRNDVETGTFGGSIAFGGTIADPTIHALIDLNQIAVRQRLAGRTVPVLTLLHVDANWDGTSASLAITGDEAPARGDKNPVRGLLNINLDLDTVKKSLKGRIAIKDFELSPLAAFLPGPLVAASGKLGSDLTITGFDPTKGEIRGFIELKGARLPIVAVLGNMRDASVRLDVDDQKIAAKVDGKIGGGTFKLEASADSRAVDTTVTATITKLTPIGVLQPQIDATAKGSFHREGFFWKGKMTVSNARVFIPEKRGNALLDDSVPVDLVFIDEPPRDPEEEKERKLGGIPEKPFLVADIRVNSTEVKIPSFQPALENGSLSVSGSVELSVGSTVGMDGNLNVERGDIDIFGRRYTLDYGTVAFEGPIDPRFDIRLTHEYTDVTTHVRVEGRPSRIDSLTPELTSEPGTYSQGQLFGFLLGGNPSADAGSANTGAAAGVGSAIASSQLKSRVLSKNSLTKQIDVLRCDPGVGTTGTSCTIGKYVKENFFVGLVYRSTPLTNENGVETQGQYNLSKHWLLNLVGGQIAQGADLLFRKRF